MSEETTIPESPTSINLTTVSSCQFVDADGNPVGDAFGGFMEITVDDRFGPTINIYTTKEQP